MISIYFYVDRAFISRVSDHASIIGIPTSAHTMKPALHTSESQRFDGVQTSPIDSPTSDHAL
jgi:hypothetical protein